MKTIKYILSTALLASLCLGTSGCSEKEELPVSDDDKGIEITGFSLGMTGRTSEAESATKAGTLTGFSVNTSVDPTFKGLVDRLNKTWKLDFTLYFKDGADGDKEKKYNAGSFTGETSYTVDAATGIGTLTPGIQYYFPNYKKPSAEAFLYPTTFDAAVVENQSTASGDDLFAQDILTRTKAAIEVSHKPEIIFSHKHSMLDFVIKDVKVDDIEDVKVEVGSTTYTPYNVKNTVTSGVGNKEYMVILPEGTKGVANNPVVVIKTSGGTSTSAITYRQTINILKKDSETLAGNKCYCFTLEGTPLQISPVTVLNWATGVSIPGEYIAVTAYPTFKAESHAEQTFYFYYDNKLMESDGNGGQKAKLQKITFNKNGECTIKPDGRILTHIFTDSGSTPSDGNKLNSSITLGQMIVNVNDALNQLPHP